MPRRKVNAAEETPRATPVPKARSKKAVPLEPAVLVPRKIERLEDTFFQVDSRDGEAVLLRDPWGDIDRWIPVAHGRPRRSYAVLIEGREFEFDGPHAKTVIKGRSRETVLVTPKVIPALDHTA